MQRSTSFIAFLFGGFGALSIGCTQDFSQFEPDGSTGGGTATGTTTSSTTTTTSSAGGAGGAGGGVGGVGGVGGIGGAGGAGGGPLEDCLNGQDDDGDGDEDCADNDCTVGFSCVPNVPAAWDGPVALFDGDLANVPPCPAAFPDEEYQGRSNLVDEPAMCAACACSTPDVECTLAPLAFTTGAMCGNTVGMAAQPTAAGDCATITPPGQTSGYKAAAATATPDDCTESGGEPTLPGVNWASASLVCSGAGTGDGCMGGGVCAPRTAGPFVSGQCVWRDGDHPCPGGYNDRHVLYDENDYDDTRDCTSCSCGAPTGTCDVTTEIHAGGVCAGAAIATVTNDGSCELAAIGGSIETTIMKSGSCPPAGGSPTGAITEGTNPTTVCCVP